MVARSDEFSLCEHLCSSALCHWLCVYGDDNSAGELASSDLPVARRQRVGPGFLLALFFLRIWLLISVFADVFRSEDLSGGAKAAWVVLLVVLPYLGALVCLSARGGGMHERGVARAEAAQAAAEDDIREVVAAPSVASELSALAGPRARCADRG